MPFDREFSRAARVAAAHGRQRGIARTGWETIMPAQNAALVRALFSTLAALSDAGAILVAAIFSGTLYHLSLIHI